MSVGVCVSVCVSVFVCVYVCQASAKGFTPVSLPLPFCVRV